MDGERIRKRRRAGTTYDVTTSSGVHTPPSPLKNRSLEFTHRQGRNYQTSTSSTVEESFAQADIGLPDQPLPWNYNFYDFPSQQSEESPHIEEEEEVRITMFYLAVCPYPSFVTGE
jgi:hypothetical protein